MKLVITISRRYGTGASLIAQELSERLGVPVYDKVNVEQELGKNNYDSEVEAIRGLAKQPCIILGRCASEILKDKRNVFNVYVCADKEDRVKRIMEKESLSFDGAASKIAEEDQERAEYYYQHTGKAWGDVNNYHMILNTSELGLENCAGILMKYFEQKELV